MKHINGFTLMEVIIVITLLTILGIITIPRLIGITTVSAETVAREIVNRLEVTRRLAIERNQRYDLEFFDIDPARVGYEQYQIRNFNTGEIYREDIYKISRNITCQAITSAQRFAFYSDGSCQVLDSAGNQVSNDGIRVTGSSWRYEITVVESTGKVNYSKQRI